MNPDGRWVAQQARNLSISGALDDPRFLIRERDTKFVAGFDEVFRSDGVKVVQTPFRAPQANAHAEPFVRTARTECLDRLLILGPRHLDRVLRVYVTTTTPSAHTARSAAIHHLRTRRHRRHPHTRKSRDATDSAASCANTTSPQRDREPRIDTPSGPAAATP